MDSPDQGIVHVIGPELGLTQPGMTIVCGDSHTSTHGAFGALAFGIGTSEVEHVLATQCLPQRKPKTMLIDVRGSLPKASRRKTLPWVSSARSGPMAPPATSSSTPAKPSAHFPMEGRMTLCNMSIEAGARAGMVAPDETTFTYLKDRRFAPQDGEWEKTLARWRSLPSDPGAQYDKIVEIDASKLSPFVTWGTNPGMVVPVSGRVPELSDLKTEADRRAAERMLEYMGLKPGTRVEEIAIDRVFIGSCTNSRLEDLRAAARVAQATT